MPLEIDRARNVPRAVYLRPTMRASGLFGPNLDELKFRLQLGIIHNLVAQRFATLCYDLDHCLHFTPTFSRKSLALQCLFRTEFVIGSVSQLSVRVVAVWDTPRRMGRLALAGRGKG